MRAEKFVLIMKRHALKVINLRIFTLGQHTEDVVQQWLSLHLMD